MNIIRSTDPYGPSINKDAYLHERDPTINDVLKYLKHPYLRLYSNRIDAIRNHNPLNNRSRIKTDLNINLGDTRQKLWYGTDNNQKLIDAQKRLAFSKSKLPVDLPVDLPDDLNEKIGEYFTQKAGKKFRNKTKKGGLNKKKDVYNSSLENQWENPHVPGKSDCCPCVFHYMGLINDDEYAELYDKYGETGMHPLDIQTFFKSKYPHFNFKLERADLTKIGKNKAGKFIIDMFKTIKKGHVAVGGIIREDNTKHCIVFSRTNDNKIAIHDSQMETLYNDGHEVTEYFSKNRVRQIYYLSSNYEKNKTNKIDKLLLDSNNSPLNFYTPEPYSSDYYTPTKSKTKSKSKSKSKTKTKSKSKSK